MSKWLELINSRKFWLAVLTLVGVLVQHFWGWNLNAETLFAAISPILALIIGQAHVDATKLQQPPQG